MAVVVNAEDRFRDSDFDREEGSALGWEDRLFVGFRDGKIFDYGEWAARDIAAMMKKPGKHRQIEAVLTYPTSAAERSIVAGTKRGARAPAADSGSNEVVDWLVNYFELDEFSGGCVTPLDLVIDQMTSAAIYKKSFHEIEWTVGGEGDYAGQIVPRGIYWRPQTTTRLLRDPNNGNRPVAIEQDPLHLGDKVRSMNKKTTIEIPLRRALVHIHGARRDPINGVSDMEVPYWAYKTQQKILFLWMQFAEGTALPKAIVKAQDDDTATRVGKTIAAAGGSGIIPVGVDGRPDSVDVTQLDMAGSAYGVFHELMTWLGETAVDAVLAGFLNLTGADKAGGSRALSTDASDFFLQSLEGKNREVERDIRSGPDATGGGLFLPMIRHNFGPKAPVPRLQFEALTAEDRAAAVDMMKALIGSRDPSLVPDEFLIGLGQIVGDYMGMDGYAIGESFRGMADKAAKQAEQKSAAAASPAGQNVAKMAAGVGAAAKMVKNAKAGKP